MIDDRRMKIDCGHHTEDDLDDTVDDTVVAVHGVEL
jgi:hypothetical protein